MLTVGILQVFSVTGSAKSFEPDSDYFHSMESIQRNLYPKVFYNVLIYCSMRMRRRKNKLSSETKHITANAGL